MINSTDKITLWNISICGRWGSWENKTFSYGNHITAHSKSSSLFQEPHQVQQDSSWLRLSFSFASHLFLFCLPLLIFCSTILSHQIHAFTFPCSASLKFWWKTLTPFILCTNENPTPTLVSMKTIKGTNSWYYLYQKLW